MKKKYLFLTVITTVLILGATIGGTMSYFTANASASGGLKLNLGPKTEITEKVPDSHTKQLTVTNDADSVPVYVRAQAFVGTEYKDSLNYSGEGWSKSGDYYLYADLVDPGESTTVLKVTFTEPENAKDGDTFNVIVVYEATPVQYDDSGNVIPAASADWDVILDTGVTEGGE